MLATIAWGNLPNWILVGVALIVSWKLSKSGGGMALAEHERANTRLTTSLKEAREELAAARLEIAALQTKLARLEGQTNVAVAMTPLVDWTLMHERRAHERHAALIVVLDLIAERLGPDPNGHPA